MPRYRPASHAFGWLIALSAAMATVSHGLATADEFTYVDEKGETQTVSARLLGTGQGRHALELADGQVRLVPQERMRERKIADGPTPLTPEQMSGNLEERFGKDRVRILIRPPFVIALVLTAPIPKAAESQADAFLGKAGRFTNNVENVFESFAKKMKLEIEPPRYPLVLLIFETDVEFEKYVRETTQEETLAANRVAGFYSGITNYLAIRMSECDSFSVPLHEAIHQQVYNRRLLQRLAPIPTWFDEGIATSFEGEGDRVAVGVLRVNTNYARRALAEQQVDLSTIFAQDAMFRSTTTAGDAYTHAWSLHWLLVTRHAKKYAEYVKFLSEKSTLSTYPVAERLADFERIVGKPIEQIQTEVRPELERAIRRQKVSLKPANPPGVAVTQAQLGEVEMRAVTRADRGAAMQVAGRLRNISLFRPMAFHIAVVTDAGTYAEWHIPNLGPLEETTLDAQFARKQIADAPGGAPRTFRVNIRSVTIDSDEAKAWAKGNLPTPESPPR